MKFFCVVLLLFSTACFAQDASLTKEETVNYLAKKYKAFEGNNFWSYTCTSSDLTYSNEKLSMKMSYYMKIDQHTYYYDEAYEFNPLYIKDIQLQWIEKSKSYFCKITLTQAATRTSKDFGGNSVTMVYEVPFYGASFDDCFKIKKALSHFLDLLKAEDDPFGN